MDVKRIMSGIFGIPLVIVVLLFSNKFIIDIILALIALIAMHEYLNAVSKISKPVKWIGYISCLSISMIHLITKEYFNLFITTGMSSVLTILFLHIIVTDMKINFKDISYTFFGIFYVVFFISFFGFIYGLENGKILIWYAIIAAWGTDIFAYITGKHLGKHKFSKVSPKKSIEGCIGGAIGAVILSLIYTYLSNMYWGTNYSYLIIIVIEIFLSLIGQIGDFAASSIKRYVEIKDFGNLIPGHGGILDRIDSLIFLAPFAYVLLTLL